MKIAIASGKGGTGKTTVATNLAWLAAHAGVRTAYVDCDAEEPNGHLFLNPVIETSQTVHKLVPQVDAQRCTACGECARFCQFHAIACLGKKTLIYPELCHACGGCRLICPQEAIVEIQREVGRVETGRSAAIHFVQGRLCVGEAQSPPVVRAAKEAVPAADLILFDAPPGTSCPVVETVKDNDFLLLVTEPTPFGLHDLRLALELANILKLDCGVVINRALPGREDVRELCQQANIPVLAEIPENMAVARAYSEGRLAVEAVPEMKKTFAKLLLALAARAGKETFSETVRHRLESIACNQQEPSRHA